jgi:uncharacterized protein DUF6516
VLSAADQLQRFEAALLRTGGIIEEIIAARADERDEVGVLAMALRFPPGHHLHARLAFSVQPGYPLWVRYSFHLGDPNGRCIFRYDNEAHHPTMTTFPHHKHVGPGETPRESQQPTLHQIVAETLEALGQG